MINFAFDFSERNEADDIIDALIEQVCAAYPPKRLERVKARTAASWKDRGYGGGPFGDRISYVALNPDVPEAPGVPEGASGYQADMINQLKFMLHNSATDCEYYPAFTSGLEQVAIPSLFGCVKESLSASEHVKPMIRSPSGVYSLPPAEPREGFVCYEILRQMAYRRQRAGASRCI